MWRLPPIKPLEPHAQSASGLLVTGVHARCGKTVFCAGLVGCLFELGFRMQALKPLTFLPESAALAQPVLPTMGRAAASASGLRFDSPPAQGFRADSYSPQGFCPTGEQEFFNRLAAEQGSNRYRSPQDMDAWATPSAHQVSESDWRRLLSVVQRQVDPYVLEMPGGMSMPLRIGSQGDSADVADLARNLQAPIILVAAKSLDILSALPTAIAYATLREAPLLGWVAVETEPYPTIAQARWQEDLFYLRRQFQTPYLGELPYSPSISVEAGRQGNLYRLTEAHLDVLPIQQALNLTVPW
jgi:dethiobiotin synthetase